MTKLSNAQSQMQVLMQVALLTLSIALIFFPQARTHALRTLFYGLFYISAFIIVARALRLGHGKDTADEMVAKFQAGSPRVMTTPLERISNLAGMVAITVMALS